MKIELNTDNMDFWGRIADRAIKKIQDTRQRAQNSFDNTKAARNVIVRWWLNDSFNDSLRQSNITYIGYETEDVCATIKDAIERNQLFIHNDRMTPIASVSLSGDEYTELMNWAKPD